jgi:3-oxoacyl-[acyl-carrier-protein] synthase-3
MDAFISAISYYLPERIITNEDLVREFPEWSVEKISSKIGIQERHVTNENETAVDLAYSAANLLFQEQGINKSSVDFIILCTQSPDYILPTSACLLQEKLGLSTNIGALDINQGCSGFIYGLSLAKGLVSSGISKDVLLITSETYSKHIHKKDKGNRTIFGDAAAATLVSAEGFAKILEFSFGTDGKGAKNLIIETGACRQRKPTNKIIFDDNNNPISSDYLFMNGTEIFNFTLKTVPVLLQQILEKNNSFQNDINLFILHQANKYMLEFVRKKAKIDPEHFYYYMEKVGNTVSSTIPIALKEAINECKAEKKAKVLIAGFGVGYSWGGTILQF